SWIPGGISTSRSRSASTRPSPPQTRRGFSTTRPVPPQRGQDCARTNSPKNVREICSRRPLPAHVGHVIALVPGPAPVPPQAAQALVPVAVIELPALGAREHLVRLHRLLEALLGIGLVRHVGV